ncbi:pilus assembly PilX family protein [Desulfolithobacter sp.]
MNSKINRLIFDTVLQGEQGFVLILAMVTLLVLTLMGVFATRNTTYELNIAGNDKVARDVFYAAESGWMRAFQWIENKGSSSAPPLLNGINANPDKPLVAEVSGQDLGHASYSYTIARSSPPRKVAGNSKQYLKFSYLIASTGIRGPSATREIVVGVEKVSK